MAGMKNAKDSLLHSLTKLSFVGGSLMWAWSRLKSDLKRLGSEVGDYGSHVVDEVGDLSVRGYDTVSDTARRVSKQASKAAPKALKTVKKQREAIMGKPKKKFSFLKFLLMMGALIALAIFLLDKFLPKPYRDDELEDAWAGEDLEPTDTDPAGATVSATGAHAETASEEEEESEDEDEK